ncbi:MAG TPA: TetR/AcrR family transcriptional regulator [Dermatophilaceae bacterium]|nr:TetR/AcrR family transcriptional regulator [Dermatophilaceae bacterium]
MQARSRATYERILDATLEILDEAGWDGLNTNAVAARAGLTVPTVYAYFPDKYAIVHELFERYERARAEALGPTLRAAVALGDWEGALRLSITAAVQMRSQYRGGLALRHAMTAVPELARLAEESNARGVIAFAGLLRGWEPRLAADQAERAARVFILGTRPLIELARRGPQLDEELVAETIRMSMLYLRDVVARAGESPRDIDRAGDGPPQTEGAGGVPDSGVGA